MTVTTPDEPLTLRVAIAAPPPRVWRVLTRPEWMAKWLTDEGDAVVTSTWDVGGPLVIRGTLHGIPFENHGTIRQLEAERVLEYDYWSTLSSARLTDHPESYTLVRFELAPIETGTALTLTLSRFAEPSMRPHARMYWSATLPILRRMAEEEDKDSR